MNNKIKILAISGSIRKASSNLNVIKAIIALTTDIFTVSVFDGLADLPHYNPDLDNEHVPQQVTDFRQKVKDTDAIIICSPEYAVGVPGALKNAIDWTVSTMNFSKKPVALITASLSGEKAHSSLLGTLLILEAKMTQQTQLLIPFVQAKVNSDGKIVDDKTLESINNLTQSLIEIVTSENAELLAAPILMNG